MTCFQHLNFTNDPVISNNCFYNENNGQRKGCKWHFVNISVPPATIISKLEIELQWSCCKFLWTVGRKTLWNMKNATGCCGSDVVARSMRSHVTQLDTWGWWWRVTSWLRHEALLQVKNAWRNRDVCIQLWFVFLNQWRFKNLHPPQIVVTANDLGVVKVIQMIWVGLQVSAYWRA